MAQTHERPLDPRHSKDGLFSPILRSPLVQRYFGHYSYPEKSSYYFKRGSRIIVKRSHRSGTSRQRKRGSLLDFFCSPKEAKWPETNSKFETHKPLPKEGAFQDGDHQVGDKSYTARGLSGSYRFKRGLSPHSHSSRPQKIPKIQGGQCQLSVQSSPFWVSGSSQGIHKGFSSHSGQGQSTGGTCLPVSRRLAHSPPRSKSFVRASANCNQPFTRTWISDKLGKISSVPYSEPHLGGSSFHDRSEFSLPASGQNQSNTGVYSSSKVSKVSQSQIGAEITGSHGGHNRGGGVCSTENETDSVVPVSLLENEFQRFRSQYSSAAVTDRSLDLVGKPEKSVDRVSFAEANSRHHSHNRCQRRRVGWLDRVGVSARPVVEAPEKVAYKLSGVGSSPQDSGPFSVPFEKQTGSDSVRQSDSGDIHKQTRRHKVSNPVHANLATLDLGDFCGNNASGSTHSRQIEHQSRPAESDFCKSPGMVLKQSCDQTDISLSRDPSDRLVCHKSEQTVASVLLPEVGDGNVPCQRVDIRLEQHLGVRVPTDSLDTSGVRKSSTVQLCNNPSSSFLAQEVLVSNSSRSGSRFSQKVTRPVGSVDPRSAVTPSTSDAKSSGLETEQERFLEAGFSEQVISTLQKAVRSSTSKIYDRQWTSFSCWCHKRDVDPHMAPISYVLGFLQYLMNVGLEFNSINVYRSAISRFHFGVDGLPVGKHPLVSRFMKGVFNVKPTVKVLLPSWKLDVVFDVLQKPPFEPLAEASLKCLTLKTVFLVAITTAKRCSELQALGRVEPYIRIEKKSVRLRTVVGFLPKTARPGHLGNDIVIPSFCKKNKLLCPKRALQYYLSASGFGDHKDHLFVAFGGRQKGSPVSKRTISGWLVKLIKLAYATKREPVPKIKAHSTRAMSTTWALFNKASLQDIMRAADWRSSRTFGKFYALDMWNAKDAEFGKKVLKSVPSNQ